MPVPNVSQQKQSPRQDSVEPLWRKVRPQRIGVLSNPLSGGNRDGLGPVYQVIRRYPGILHREAATPDEVNAALDIYAAEDIELIAVNGGDGTVQAVLTGLFDRRPFQTMPALALLYGGTSNMLPKDFGLKGPRQRVLEALLQRSAAARPLAVVRRPVLKVEAAGQRSLYGMFFGAACIYKGIQFFHSKVHTLGLRGELAHGIVVARFLGALLTRNSELVAPQAIGVQLDTDNPMPDKYLVFLISSLEKLILGLRPYWGRGPGPLHLTAVEARPKYLLKAVAGFIRGTSNRYLKARYGYHSHDVEAVDLRLQGGFTLDGELYRTDAPNDTVSVSTGGRALFVCQHER